MEDKNRDDLKAIRTMMEQASRFISLSGWSGISAGIYALIASGIAYTWMNDFYSYNVPSLNGLLWKFILLGLVTLFLAISTGVLFTVKKSKKNKVAVWNANTKRLLLHLFVPLLVGGLFCLALFVNHASLLLMGPTTLIFYGLALLNASKFTFKDIAYLGYCEIVLGLIGLFIPGYGLLLWAIGFGVLHIVYGIVIERKYR
ncbi:MAG TPA: hypothetical protein VL021_06230 [Brumimicrobium sp.]|nr:hypothetical protein [Brumimicrobium sp.]